MSEHRNLARTVRATIKGVDMIQSHQVTQVAADDQSVTYACSGCGWVLIDYSAGAYAMPFIATVAESIAAHQAEFAAMADGSVWDTLGEGYRLYLLITSGHGCQRYLTLRAEWTGGFAVVDMWRNDATGRADAAAGMVLLGQEHIIRWNDSQAIVTPESVVVAPVI